ncbi:SGNH/GDSL hydrolase family protein, partial [Nonomuraea lactucae]|uniref:SGNH/GDSL hydrolase family protein n=1 Tax=Nonomuraea lactucae TaxID=2249762 RepID=UPI001F06D8F2
MQNFRCLTRLVAIAMAIVLTLSLSKVPAQAQSACGLTKFSRAAAEAAANLSIRCGAEAKAAGSTLNVADGDVVIDFTFDNVDPETFPRAVEEQHDPNIRLSDAIRRGAEPGMAHLEAQTSDTEWMDDFDFDGDVEARSDGVTFVIREEDVHAELALWLKVVIASLAGYAAQLLVFGACIGALPAFIIMCQSFSSGANAAIGWAVGTSLDPDGPKPSTTDVMIAILVAALLAGIGAAAWDRFIKPWMINNMRGLIVSAASGIARLSQKIGGWFSTPIKNGLGWVAQKMGQVAEKIVNKMLEAAEGRGFAVTEAKVRLMPLGDSITHGVGSSTNAGYRAPLYDQMKYLGRDVDFVGSLDDGSFADNDHEGHSGWRIDEIDKDAEDCAVPAYRPNVVTLHAGTNDMNQDYQLATAPERLGGLIDQVLAHAPDATVLVATLVPATKDGLQPRIDAYNARIPAIVKQRQDQGKHVQLVEMDEVTTADLSQPAHPGDSGYSKMAHAWYEAFLTVEQKGWISDPVSTGSLPGVPGSLPSCTADPDQTKAGPGWRALGVIATGMTTPEGRTDIMELDGDNRGDYVRIADGGGFRIARNTPGQPGQPV